MNAATDPSGLRLVGVDVRIGAAQIVRDLHLECAPGAFIGLLGPNGSGKSTALKTVYRALAPSGGQVLLNDRDLLRELTARQSAQHIAALTQDPEHNFEFTVLEVAATGLTPHKSAWSPTTRADHQLLDDVLDIVGMRPHAHRPFATLSGGEKQRVLLARALAQRPSLLVLDEPTNHLDINTQLALLRLVRSLGITVLAALHDLNLAAAYCDQLYLLDDGVVVCGGTPRDVLTPDRIASVFGVRAHCGTHPLTGRLHLAFDHLSEHDPPTDPVPADHPPASHTTAEPTQVEHTVTDHAATDHAATDHATTDDATTVCAMATAPTTNTPATLPVLAQFASRVDHCAGRPDRRPDPLLDSGRTSASVTIPKGTP